MLGGSLPAMANVSDSSTLGTEQYVYYFVNYGFGELKVVSQVVANVLLSMLAFFDDAISDAFRDLCRGEALKHKVEQNGPQREPPFGYG
jgi:hypothetical protein